MSVRRRPVTWVAVILAATTLVSGCAQAEPEPSGIVTSETVSAEGVLLAAVLLANADIEAAVAEGLVTPDEVDEARRAIDDGTLDAWRELAESTDQD